MDSLINVLRKTEGLRISCSDIGAIAGFHPYVDLPELFMKYLYQDLDMLQQIDAQVLGISLISVEDEAMLIVQKLDQTAQTAIQGILDKTTQKTELQSKQQANTLIDSVKTILADKKVTSTLGAADLQLIQREFKGKIRKRYGTYCEDQALEMYAEITGFPVVERNLKTYVHEILPLVAETAALTADAGSSTGAGAGTGTGTSASTDSEMELIDLTDDPPAALHTADSTASTSSSQPSSPPSLAEPQPLPQPAVAVDAFAIMTARPQFKRKRTVSKVKPAFVLVGRVDGVSYQLDMTSDDATQWAECKVIVEMKTRVQRIQKPPPLYEQIQLVSYMVMLGAVYGDLVQYIPSSEAVVVKEDVLVATNGTELQAEAVTITEAPSTIDELHIHRVLLHGPPYNHFQHWESTILPRLHVFKDAVLSVRKDDGMRHAFLLAGEEEKLAMVMHLCPYFT